MDPYLIVLADDHHLVRQGLKALIEKAADLRVVGEASNGLELLELLNELSANMAILDITMPKLRGIEAAEKIKKLYPEIKILMLSMHKDKDSLDQALSSGADGYLVKEDAPTELFSAIERIRQGGSYVSSIIHQEIKDLLLQKYGGRGSPSSSGILTSRESQILNLIAEGKSSKEIAGLISISIRTVEKHRSNIMKKLHIKKSIDLVRYVLSKEYTSPNA